MRACFCKAVVVSVLLGVAGMALAAPPKVIKAVPDNGATDVDPNTRQITITFDQTMSRGGYSIVGGGPKFPKIIGKPRWTNARTLVLNVKLEADHEYRLSVNSNKFQNFRNTAGEAAVPYPIAFKTAPADKTAADAPDGDDGTPRVLKTEPANGATDVDPNTRQITVTFNQDMSRNGHSIVGGGPQFPKIIGKPRWLNPRTFVFRVKLEADHEYALSINSGRFTNFRTTDGEPVKPYPIEFSTASASTAARTSEQDNLESIAILADGLDRSYSYRDRLGIDWAKRIEAHTKTMASAKTPEAFARRAAKLLAEAKDPHIWLRIGDKQIGTYRRRFSLNYNEATLSKTIPNYSLGSGGVATGRFDDGVGYIRIPSWNRNKPKIKAAAMKALAKFADAPGLIIDVRPNGGGAEPMAREFAGCFIDTETPYAKHDVVQPYGDKRFSPVRTRTFSPTAGATAYQGKTALLIGPRVLSSCEAFVMMMSQVPTCKTFGATTGGSSGNPKPLELANGVVVYLPCWRSMTVEGTMFEGKGIDPDVPVTTTATQLRKSDPVVEAALKYLRS